MCQVSVTMRFSPIFGEYSKELSALRYALNLKTSEFPTDSIMLYFLYKTLYLLINHYFLTCYPITAQRKGLFLSHPETWLLCFSKYDKKSQNRLPMFCHCREAVTMTLLSLSLILHITHERSAANQHVDFPKKKLTTWILAVGFIILQRMCAVEVPHEKSTSGGRRF